MDEHDHDIIKQAKILERIAHYIAMQEIEPTEEMVDLIRKLNEAVLNHVKENKAQDKEER